MKPVIAKNLLSALLLTTSFGLLTFASLTGGLEEYLKLNGADYLRLSSLITMVMTMTCMMLVGTLWLRVKIGPLLFYTSIPIGLIWSINEFITTLTDMSGRDELAMAVTNMLLPAFLSGLACALAYFLTPRIDVKTHHEPHATYKKISGLVAIPFVAIIGMYATYEWTFTVLWGWEPIVILFSCFVMALVREQLSTELDYRSFGLKNWANAILDGGKISAFLGAAIVALFYIAFSRLDVPKVLGPVTAIGLDTILIGVMAYLAGLLSIITNARWVEEADLRLDAWHLAEAYAFVLLAVVGPASLFDAFS